MKTISQKIEEKQRNIAIKEHGLYSIIKSLCKDNEIALEYIMSIHDEIVEEEVSTLNLMRLGSNYEAEEKYKKDINTKPDGYSFKEQTGFVYILRDRGNYKIGKTTCIKDRLKAHKCSNLNIEFLYGSKEVYKHSKLEAFLHASFSDKRVYNEWFNLNKEELERAMEIIKQWEINNGFRY